MKKKIIGHLKGDIKTFNKEAAEDKELIRELRGKKMANKKRTMKKPKKKKESRKEERKESKGMQKFEKVMHEFKEGALRSGSKKGPKVANPKQAIAIAFSEKRRAGRK